MKKLIAGVVLGVGLTAMAHGAGDPQAGEQNAAVCAGCHGQNGAKPIMGSYPKLSGLGEKYLYRQLVLIKDKERNIAEMTGILDNMNDQDLQDLAAYFNAQEMVVGVGNEPAGYPALGGQNAEYLVKQLNAYRDGARDSGANASIMMDVASKLTDAEIEAVSSYISGLN
eukprot:g4767.t1